MYSFKGATVREIPAIVQLITKSEGRCTLKTKIRLLTGTLLAALCLAGCGGTQNWDDGGIIRIAYNQAPTHPHYQALEITGQKFEELTNGRYQFLIYPNAVLGDQRATLELVQSGALQMAAVNNAIVENYNKDFAVLGLPYVFDSQEHQERVFLSGAMAEVFESTKAEGFEVVAAYTAGSRNVYTKKLIEKPEDMKGLKIRVMESPTMVATLNYMGGAGTPMNQGEVYTAIQQGVLDGGENNEITYYDMKHYEVAPYFSRTQHIMIPDLIIAGSDFLEKMPEEDRNLLRELLQESIKLEFELWNKDIDTAIAAAEAEGVIFSDVEIGPFQQRCLPLHEEVTAGSPTAKRLYDAIREQA